VPYPLRLFAKGGDVSKLQGQDWYMLDMTQFKRHIEPTRRRICQQIPAIFGGDPFEMFVVDARDDLSEL
jgi:hypothetical protein